MRHGHTQRICPSCRAVATTERVTCDHCGELTVVRVTLQGKADGRQG
jgi:predicted amidophosphoribosyltransferase